MTIDAPTLRRIASLNLAPEAMAEVLNIIADIQEKEDLRKEAQRNRTRKSRDGNVTVTSQERDIPPNGFPLQPLSLTPQKETKENPLKGAKEKKEKVPRISLDELSVDHIRDWLARKRTEGRYLDYDEYFILEYFVNYCKSKGKKYEDYIAAYRNAFEWDACKPGKQGGSTNSDQTLTKDERAKRAAIEGYRSSLAMLSG